MVNCRTCKYSDETIKNVLVCFHKLHPLSQCIKIEHDCQEYEVGNTDETKDPI